MRICVIIAMILLAAAGAAFSQTDQQQSGDDELKKSYLYQWTDERGVVHITDGLGNVPEQYRDRAMKVEQPKSEEGAEGQQGVTPGTYSPAAPDEDVNEDLKAEWQMRVKRARQQLAAAEQRYHNLDQKRLEALGKGSPATGNLAGRSEAEQIQQEMRMVQQEIDDIRHEIDVDIPDQARKAGIPPGWLRE